MDSSFSVVNPPVDIAVEQPVADVPAQQMAEPAQVIEQAPIVDQLPVDQVEAMVVDEEKKEAADPTVVADAIAATVVATTAEAQTASNTEVSDAAPVAVADVPAPADGAVEAQSAVAAAAVTTTAATIAETKAETPKNLTAISAAIRAKVKAPKKTPADTTKPKANRITGKLLDKMIHSRQKADLHYHSKLFKSKKSVLLGKNGDVRHMDCETLSKIGPYEAGTQFKVIDYIATANVMFMSQSGKIMDTVMMPLQPVAVEGETLIDPFAVSPQ